MTCFSHLASPLGDILLASRGESLTGLWLEGQRDIPSDGAECETPVLAQAKDWLRRYFSGEKPLPGELALAPEGSEFRKNVWRLLLRIPYGSTVTYGELARAISPTMSAQAVGGAVGHNPISVIIPCHRVIGADGGLTGYAGGLDKKLFLLALEGAYTIN